jgi:3-deoxy-manno-octulosonate cytidylyltransferase (CMP-KDO synthetase)
MISKSSRHFWKRKTFAAQNFSKRGGGPAPRFHFRAADASVYTNLDTRQRLISNRSSYGVEKSMSMKAIAVIPARLASTRLPRKMLREITGKPLIGVVYEAVRSSPLLADVIVATDSGEIMAVCRTYGWNAQMTSPHHRSGTERVHEVSGREAADVYINVQGDEPLVRPEQLATLLQVMENPAAEVGTIMTPCAPIDVPNPNAVKIVTDLNGRALYFSRATIPFDRDGAQPQYFKHLGLYAYRKSALDRFVTLPESSLEKSERLEQLRFLENGIGISVGKTPHDSVGVDTEEDLQRVIEILRNR